MFSVIFEVHPKSDRWDDYLDNARLLRPELVKVDGFIDNVRYKSLRRPGWLLSHSTWRDEKALVRWRTVALHHDVQVHGREAIFQDYRIRVGQITADNRLPLGQALREQRLDETETGTSKMVTITEAPRAAGPDSVGGAETIAQSLGLVTAAEGLIEWDVFEAVLTPGDMVLLASWRDGAVVEDRPPAGARHRRVRVIRDYTMFDRREAPQYYPEAKRATTVA
jgi:heme-degrading monooxygenase HmoA